MKEYVLKLKCLGDETRLRMLNLLVHFNVSLCVCELVDALEVPAYTVSRHMKELKNAQIVEEARDGKFIMYSLVKDRSLFFSTMLSLVGTISGVLLEEDIKNVQSRLNLRRDGRCVIGMKNTM